MIGYIRNMDDNENNNMNRENRNMKKEKEENEQNFEEFLDMLMSSLKDDNNSSDFSNMVSKIEDNQQEVDRQTKIFKTIRKVMSEYEYPSVQIERYGFKLTFENNFGFINNVAYAGCEEFIKVINKHEEYFSKNPYDYVENGIDGERIVDSCFERVYSSDFSVVLDNFRCGFNGKFARASWLANEDNKFIYYVPASSYDSCTDVGNSIANENGKVNYSAYIAMFDKDHVVMYTPSQDDMFANDWYVIND